MKMSKQFWLSLLTVTTGLSLTSVAIAGAHSRVNMERSSITNHVFVTQAVEGEFGKYKVNGDDLDETQTWKGYGIRTGVGMEIMKFVQFSAGHTFLNMREKGNGLENMRGSRLNGETKVIFYSPVGNLEGAFGLTGLRMDYQKLLDSAEFYGSGYYYSLGINYFVAPSLSFFGNARVNNENMVKNSGAAQSDQLKVDTTSMGAGFTLWL